MMFLTLPSSRAQAELEATQKELKHVHEELVAVNYTQESKIGRQLVAKCRALADENEEMGRELAEGKTHQVRDPVKPGKGAKSFQNTADETWGGVRPDGRA